MSNVCSIQNLCSVSSCLVCNKSVRNMKCIEEVAIWHIIYFRSHKSLGSFCRMVKFGSMFRANPSVSHLKRLERSAFSSCFIWAWMGSKWSFLCILMSKYLCGHPSHQVGRQAHVTHSIESCWGDKRTIAWSVPSLLEWCFCYFGEGILSVLMLVVGKFVWLDTSKYTAMAFMSCLKKWQNQTNNLATTSHWEL